MKLAICDDDVQDLGAVVKLMTEYCQLHPDVSYDTYSNSTELLHNLKEHNYQALLLDILMPGVNGIEIASEIRQSNKEIKLVFLSSSPEYAVDSYTVDAFYYLLKPVVADKLYPVLDKLREQFTQPAELLHIKTAQQVFAIPFNKIVSVEITCKTLHFYLTDGTEYAIAAPLSDYESLLLQRPEFAKTHRSYLVNLQHMRILNPTEFIADTDQHIPIARRSYKAIREQYVAYLFDSAGEDLP